MPRPSRKRFDTSRKLSSYLDIRNAIANKTDAFLDNALATRNSTSQRPTNEQKHSQDKVGRPGHGAAAGHARNSLISQHCDYCSS